MSEISVSGTKGRQKGKTPIIHYGVFCLYISFYPKAGLVNGKQDLEMNSVAFSCLVSACMRNSCLTHEKV